MNQLSALIEENNSLREALISVLLTVGGTVEVSDEVAASIDLEVDFMQAVHDPARNTHVITVKRRGAPDA